MSRRTLELWSALAIVYVVWGSTYLAIKVAVRTLPPLLTAGTRFVGAAFVLAGVLALLGRSLRVARREALAAAGIGVVLLAGGVGLVHVAETRIDSSVAALIAGSVPLQIVVWRTAAGERVSRATMAAAVIGLGGLALDRPGRAGRRRHRRRAARDARRARSPRRRLVMARSGSRLRPAARARGGRLRRSARRRRSLVRSPPGVAAPARGGGPSSGLSGTAARVGLLLAGSVLAFSAYVWLLDNAPISQVVTHQYVNPLVAVALGALILDERPGPTTLAGAALIVGAAEPPGRSDVVVTARSEGRRPTEPQPVATPRRAFAARRGTRADRSA